MEFLERLLGQSKPRQLTIPEELEEFANQLQHGIDNHLSLKRQQQLEKENAEKGRISAEATEKSQAEAKRRELLEQEKLRLETTASEANKVFDDFQIPQKLKYIQETAWVRKGTIQIVAPVLDVPSIDSRKRLGGLELVHFYPDCVSAFRSGIAGCDTSARAVTYLQYYRGAAGTHLSVMLNEYLGKEGKIIRSLAVRSGIMHLREDPEIYSGYQVIIQKYISVDQAGNKSDLDKALIEDTAIRTAEGFLPFQLEKEASERVARAKQSRKWLTAEKSAGLCHYSLF